MLCSCFPACSAGEKEPALRDSEIHPVRSELLASLEAALWPNRERKAWDARLAGACQLHPLLEDVRTTDGRRHPTHPATARGPRH